MWINVFEDFYQNFSQDSTWSANEVGQIYRNITSTKIKKKSRYPSINKIFLLFAPMGFRIAEYNDRPMIGKKKWVSLSRKMDANPGK